MKPLLPVNPELPDVAKVAVELWTPFVKLYPGLVPKKLFDRSKQINPIVRSFFKFCAQLIYNVPNAEIIFDSLSTLSLPSVGWGGRPVSWLYRQPGKRPVIYIDKSLLSEGTEIQLFDRNKIISRIALHETGHLALHWDYLDPLMSKGAKPCTPQQESEAWWFCASILALALGDYARISRSAIPLIHDPTWEHV